MTLLVLRFIMIIVIVVSILGLAMLIIKALSNDEDDNRVVRYEQRFDPESNKYYIVSITKIGKEESLRRWYGSRIMYKNAALCEYVLEKMNSVFK